MHKVYLQHGIAQFSFFNSIILNMDFLKHCTFSSLVLFYWLPKNKRFLKFQKP